MILKRSNSKKLISILIFSQIWTVELRDYEAKKRKMLLDGVEVYIY